MRQAPKHNSRTAKTRRLPAAGLAAVLIALGMLASGCGGGSPTGPAGTTSSAQAARLAVAFSVCMRVHGVPNYADPHISNSGGGTQATVHGSRGAGSTDPHSPAFMSAERACRHLLPNDRPPSGGGANGAQAHAQALRFAVCMRTHGVADFPDPGQDDAFNLPPQINQQAPQYKRAIRICMTRQSNTPSINQGGG